MSTNVQKENEFPKMIVPAPLKQDFIQRSEHLTHGKHFNNDYVDKCLYKINPSYLLLKSYIVVMTCRQPKLSFLSAVSIELDPKVIKLHPLGQHYIREYLTHFVSFGLLVRLSPRKHTYYINPNMSHYLTVEQRNEWPQYQHMFKPFEFHQMLDQDSLSEAL